MRRKRLYDLKEKSIKLKVPIILCPNQHLHVPVGKLKECLICKYKL